MVRCAATRLVALPLSITKGYRWRLGLCLSRFFAGRGVAGLGSMMQRIAAEAEAVCSSGPFRIPKKMGGRAAGLLFRGVSAGR